MKLHLAANFTLPADAVTQTFAILGIRGSGKTNTAVVLAEELLASKQQVVIIDPVDVWWGLKSGFPIPVIGGEHSDVPLDAGAGPVLADFVVDTRASVILSLRHLSMNEQRKFAGDFAKRLYERKGQQRSPMMLIVDEADEFVPQRLPHGHEAMFGAFDRLVRRGRSSGIGVTLISQRAQVINKDVLSQMETLIGMRVLHKLDRKALEAWIEAHDTEGRKEEFLESLASLGRGQAWIWSPSWLNVFHRVQIRARNTFDSSGTPKAGESVAPPKELEPVDLEKLRASMAQTIQKAKAEDPRELRAEIARLKADLARKPESQKSAPDPAAVDRIVAVAVAKAIKAVQEAAQTEIGAVVRTTRRAMQDTSRKLRECAEVLDRALPPESMNLHVQVDVPPAPAPVPARSSAAPPVTPRHSPNGTGKLSKGGRRVLTALAQFGESADTKVAALSGLVASAGHFGNILAELRTAGYIDGPRSALRITAAGAAALGAYEPLPTGRSLHEWWIGRLSKGAGEILRELIDAYPRPLSDHELAERTGKSAGAGHFGNLLSELRTRDLIAGTRSALRASEDLFA